MSPYGTMPVLPPSPSSSTCGDSDTQRSPPSLGRRALRWLTSCWTGSQRTGYRVHRLEAGEVEPLLEDGDEPHPHVQRAQQLQAGWDEKEVVVVVTEGKPERQPREERRRWSGAAWVPRHAKGGFLRTATARVMKSRTKTKEEEETS